MFVILSRYFGVHSGPGRSSGTATAAGVHSKVAWELESTMTRNVALRHVVSYALYCTTSSWLSDVQFPNCDRGRSALQSSVRSWEYHDHVRCASARDIMRTVRHCTDFPMWFAKRYDEISHCTGYGTMKVVLTRTWICGGDRKASFLLCSFSASHADWVSVFRLVEIAFTSLQGGPASNSVLTTSQLWRKGRLLCITAPDPFQQRRT